MHVDPVRPTRLRDTPPLQKTGLTLDGVRHAYGARQVVHDMSLRIADGELLCLLGPSGCGKTTTLRIAAGLEDPLGGTVWIGDRVVAGADVFVPPEQRGIGFLFQDYALFPHLSVLENVRFGMAHLPRAEGVTHAMAALKRVGMDAYAAAYPHTLSGGQQQRVGLARALAPRPRLMLLDEPFSGLDKRLRDQVRDQTLHLLKDSGVSTLMVTHDPEEAMFMADTIALMRDGHLEQVGNPVELYCRPRTAFAARFFGEVNSLRALSRKGRVETPLGVFEAPEGARDGAVEVLIRPEGLRLEAVQDGDDPAVAATVAESRMLGRSSLIHLRIDTPSGPLHLHSRMPGLFLPPPGEPLAIMPDRSQVFVFPADADL